MRQARKLGVDPKLPWTYSLKTILTHKVNRLNQYCVTAILQVSFHHSHHYIYRPPLPS